MARVSTNPHQPIVESDGARPKNSRNRKVEIVVRVSTNPRQPKVEPNGARPKKSRNRKVEITARVSTNSSQPKVEPNGNGARLKKLRNTTKMKIMARVSTNPHQPIVESDGARPKNSRNRKVEIVVRLNSPRTYAFTICLDSYRKSRIRRKTHTTIRGGDDDDRTPNTSSHTRYRHTTIRGGDDDDRTPNTSSHTRYRLHLISGEIMPVHFPIITRREKTVTELHGPYPTLPNRSRRSVGAFNRKSPMKTTRRDRTSVELEQK
ncbi:hypothetical protein QE152_g25947 [Popillia japonica]|uniref:Uncharacterized protein n=1 Tax=Popillia japonica TaxID=7064 RepID=A0AAW1JZG3_POPJA